MFHSLMRKKLSSQYRYEIKFIQLELEANKFHNKTKSEVYLFYDSSIKLNSVIWVIGYMFQQLILNRIK